MLNTSIDCKIVGKRIKAQRKAKKMTQEELASAVSVTQQTVAHWEKGKSLPTVENLQMICNELSCDSDYIIGMQSMPTHSIADVFDIVGLEPDSQELLSFLKETNDLKALSFANKLIQYKFTGFGGDNTPLLFDFPTAIDTIIEYKKDRDLTTSEKTIMISGIRLHISDAFSRFIDECIADQMKRR